MTGDFQAPLLATSLKKDMLTLLLFLMGLLCFALFFKSIDFFDKI
jgi:hypothetical protein